LAREPHDKGMKFVKVWKDSRPERGEDMIEDIEEEEIPGEMEDRALWKGGGAEKLRPCERSTTFICADG